MITVSNCSLVSASSKIAVTLVLLLKENSFSWVSPASILITLLLWYSLLPANNLICIFLLRPKRSDADLSALILMTNSSEGTALRSSLFTIATSSCEVCARGFVNLNFGRRWEGYRVLEFSVSIVKKLREKRFCLYLNPWRARPFTNIRWLLTTTHNFSFMKFLCSQIAVGI